MLDAPQSERGGGTKSATNPHKLKIAISIWSFTPNTGGLQAHAQNLCTQLQQRGHEVWVVTRSATRIPVGADYLFANEPGAEITVANIPVRPLRFSRAWAPVLWLILKCHARPAFARVAAWLYQLVAAKSANTAFAGSNIIHHVGHATALVGFAAAQAAKHHRIPFLVQPTAHPFHFGDSNLDFHLYRKADRLLVHTKYEQEFFISQGIPCPLTVVYNGIEDRSNGSGDRFRAKYHIVGDLVLYLGRKTVDKGYPLVIDAFALLAPKFPDVTLVCIGPAPLIVETRATPRILELSFVTEAEKHDALAACTCLCVPSEGESFGLVYMEAGRYRKPALCRNLPVLRELLGTENAALLLGHPVDQKNQVSLTAAELAAGLQKILNHPELCRAIGDACHQVSEKFLWPIVVTHFENAYRTMRPLKASA